MISSALFLVIEYFSRDYHKAIRTLSLLRDKRLCLQQLTRIIQLSFDASESNVTKKKSTCGS
jgi:hypothetical protein